MNVSGDNFLRNISVDEIDKLNNSATATIENALQIPVDILLCLAFFIGLFGNVSVCVVIVRKKILHTTTNYYLFSLATSDLFIIIFSLLPWVLKIVSQKDIFTGFMCVTRKVASKTGYFATLLTMLAVSVERYLAVCHPLARYKTDKLSRTVKIIIAFWIVAFCLALPKAFYTPCYGNIENLTQTIDLYKFHLELLTFVSYVITMTIIIVFYVLIGLKLRQVKKVSSTSSIDQKKAIKLLVAVVIALLVSWTPTRIYRFYIFYLTVDPEKMELENSAINYYTRKITGSLYYAVSTVINPLIYSLMSTNFRKGFMECFPWKKMEETSI